MMEYWSSKLRRSNAYRQVKWQDGDEGRTSERSVTARSYRICSAGEPSAREVPMAEGAVPRLCPDSGAAARARVGSATPDVGNAVNLYWLGDTPLRESDFESSSDEERQQ